jgi:integrase
MSKKRRGNGEGSIYQRADGTWCATYATSYTQTGRRKRRTIFGKTKQAVQDKLQKLLHDAASGVPAATERITVGDFLDRWLTSAAKTSVIPRWPSNWHGTHPLS